MQNHPSEDKQQKRETEKILKTHDTKKPLQNHEKYLQKIRASLFYYSLFWRGRSGYDVYTI